MIWRVLRGSNVDVAGTSTDENKILQSDQTRESSRTTKYENLKTHLPLLLEHERPFEIDCTQSDSSSLSDFRQR